eukprot:UN08282
MNYKAYPINILIRLMCEYPTKVPNQLGPRFYQLFKVLHHLKLSSINTIALWVIQHLVQFSFRFPWNTFDYLNLLNDPTHIQLNFFKYVITHCIQLTTFSHVATHIQKLWLLLPNVDPYFNMLKLQQNFN